jgi:SAM-dependent methyltransferase
VVNRIHALGIVIIAVLSFSARMRSEPSRSANLGTSVACLQAAQLTSIATSLRSESGAVDSYAAVVRLAFNTSEGAQRLTAFEENRSFVDASEELAPGVFRRLIILKPATFIVDDQMPAGLPDPVCLHSQSKPETGPGQAVVTEGNYRVRWECPQKPTYEVGHADGYVLRPSFAAGSASNRAVSLIELTDETQIAAPRHATCSTDHTPWTLTVPSKERVFHLWLPNPADGAGEIEISAAGGTVQLQRQPLPSGVLPHGVGGNRLLDTWDAAYRQSTPPAWDIGRPADELQKLVRDGTVRKCRAVDLGCGSGTDAIYLASQGFDVTGIDISPTALALAEEKARKAGVSVRWMLADVTALPEVGPFDFIYDRGCYHNVRDQNLEAYIETLRRLSHHGTRLLILSARRDAQSAAGAPGVTEEELRFDFSTLFQVESLRAIMLETNEARVHAPGWSAMLRREAVP